MKTFILFTLIFLTGFKAYNQIFPDWVATSGGDININYYTLDVFVDKEGNSYIFGSEIDSSYNSVGKIIKYDNQGILQWTISRDSLDYYGKIAVDKNKNVYITNRINTQQSHSVDYLTVKYNYNGVFQWEKRYDGISNETDIPKAICVDDSLNVYVTGGSVGVGPGSSNIDYDFATIKYDSTGLEKWVARYNYSENPGDNGLDICVDSSHNVYVTGASRDTINGSNLTIKYDMHGNQIWARRYNGGLYGGGQFIELFNNKYLYVGGNISSPGWSDYLYLKYDLDGNLIWSKAYSNDSSEFGWDVPSDLTIDNYGNAYMTGTVFGGAGEWDDYGTVKFDSLGNIAWERTYNGGTSWDDAYSLVTDDMENVYVTGRSYDSLFNYSSIVSTIKYDKFGSEKWIAKYFTTVFASYTPLKISLDSLNNIYISGQCINLNSPHFFTLKYNNRFVSSEVNELSDSENELFYPNPSFDYIYFNSRDITLIEIFDLTGKKVLSSEEIESIDVSLLQNGMYVIRLTKNNEIVNTKFIKQ